MIAGCGDSSDSTPEERAAHFSHQATDELRKANYHQAEKLIAESLELYASTNNRAALTEQYALLASVQTKEGKIQPALQSLTTLRTLYKETADRNAELNTMLEMARLFGMLDKRDAALPLLEDVLLSSQLFQLPSLSARSAMQLGTLYADNGQHTRAALYLNQATAQFLQLKDTLNAVDAMIALFSSLLQRGNLASAHHYLTRCEQILGSHIVSFDAAYRYTVIGFSLLQAERWEMAVKAFEKSIAYRQTSSPSSYLVHVGLGEAFYQNYSFDNAQQAFVNAYKLAKLHAPPLVLAYMLIRIADCEMKKNAVVYVQDRSIRALQLYEHAQTLCSRAGFGFGEAVVLHRMGALKEISDDENIAVTYYKRAIDRFISANLEPSRVYPCVDFRSLLRSPLQGRPEQYLSEPLILLLLRQKKFGEALEYCERLCALSLQRIAFASPLHFGDAKKRQLYEHYRTAQQRVAESQRELLHLLPSNDNDYTVRLRQQILTAKKAFSESAASLSSAYPEFGFLSLHRSLSELTNTFLPSPVTALRYYCSANEAWVFVVRRNEPVTAVKLSSFGFGVRKKMERFITLLSSSISSESEIRHLSNELYGILLQPVEQYTAQRFLVIPPQGLEKFPFHALMKYDTPLIETTEVSYLLSLHFLMEKKPLPRFLTNVAVAGFSFDARWGLEFELRDVRSFLKNAQIILNQNASLQKLQSVKGEFLHLASRFSVAPDGECTMQLSDGSSSITGNETPISTFTSFSSFPFVYLADINTKTNSITQEHTLLWLMNGAQSIVVNELPLTPKLSRVFNEGLYSTYASTFSPYSAYRQGVLQVSRQKEFSDRLSFASYFYYGL
jgi:hypothetical protein